MYRLPQSWKFLKLVLAISALGLMGGFSEREARGEGEIGFIEDFALAEDRSKALDQLIPGTEDYYFYSALHAQNSGELNRVDQLLEPWIKQFGRTGRVQEIENRQALLRYAEDPQSTLDYLRRRLGLRFNHRRDDASRDTNLPSQLDAGLISDRALRTRALQWHKGTLQGFEDRALESLLESDLDTRRRRDLLRRLTRPDVPRLVELIVADLKQRDSGGFGYLPIHHQLLLPQLENLGEKVPNLRDHHQYVNAYLLRLKPSDDVDLASETVEREAYLNRLDAFVSELSDAHRALKAYVLYHRLEHDRRLGIYDRDRFLRYLKLPRSVSYISPDYMRRQRGGPTVGLQEAFTPYCPFPPIGTDEALVRDYLMHFFLEAEDYDGFARYIHDVYLKELFAETKIVNGLGELDKWYSWLPPSRYQALRDRVDLEFLPTNQTFFDPEESVGLDVAVKNIDSLIVKIFKINTPSHYRSTLSEIGTDIDLDGLVAHDEKVYTYEEPPLRRVVRHFDFPELKQRGVYVVELIGNGISSRALIHKGRLHHVQRLSSAGHVFTILDESSKVVESASLWLEGHEYEADKSGTITVPFSTAPGPQPIVLIDGAFASLGHFHHADEQYRLDAAFYVDREALLKRRKATALLRPLLKVHGQPISLSALENTVLSITTTDLDNVTTTREIPDFELYEDREATFEFQVPERTLSVLFQIRATVEALSRGEDVELHASSQFQLNQIDLTQHTEALYLSRQGKGYDLKLLGKTGEPRPARPVQLTLKHRDYRDPVHVTLQTDASGSIALGPLKHIASITAQGPNQVSRSWTLLDEQARYPASLHANVGDEIAIPYLGDSNSPLKTEVSLIERRQQANVRDRFGALKIDQGFLVVKGLPAGNYSLFLKDANHRIDIRITRGSETGGFFQSRHRLLEAPPAPPVQIESVSATGDSIRIQLRQTGPATRTHVIATRYLPAYNIFEHLNSITRAGLRHTTLPAMESLYVSGRNIGDEYRYILDRKYAKKFPGNMLGRPGLLLNPWAIRETQTGHQMAAEGAAWEQMKQEGKRKDAKGDMGEPQRRAAHQPLGNLDFLTNPTVTLLNLEADERGIIEIDRDALLDKTHIHVIAVNPEQTVYRQVAIQSEDEATIRDLRLSDPLDPDEHFTERKQITPMESGDVLVIEDITTSKIETYDTFAKAYRLLLTLSGNSTLREFTFLQDWPELSEEEKQDKYSEYASHELHFFLYRRDPEFFKSVVQPYLQHKKDKTFLDRWLLEEDLNDYLRPWAYSRLNAVERILLARRIEGEQGPTARHIRDAVDLTPPDLTELDRLFETALKGSALESHDAFGLDSQLREIGALDDVSLNKVASQSRVARASGDFRSANEGLEVMSMEAEAMPAAAPMPAMDAPMEEAIVGGGRKKEADVAFYDRDEARRRAVRQLYRPVDQTREWAENNYYHLPIGEQDGDLIELNPFWADYAEADPAKPFLSTHLAETAGNFAEMILALSVLDLPFDSSEPEIEFEGERMSLKATSPRLAYHKEVDEAEVEAGALPILVTQNFFRLNDRFIYEGNERRDKYVEDEFLINEVYGCQVVVTNPTSTPAKLNVLLQLPEGALPVLRGHFTRTLPVDLQAFTTRTVDYHFYFPFEGEYAHYPVHVARREQIVAAADAVRLQAVRTLSSVDTSSWEYISQHGTEDQVVQFLQDNNLGRINLDRIAWRMKDRAFFKKVVKLLTSRHHYHTTLWSYGIRHHEVATIREFLKHQDGFVAQCGAWLDSPLLAIDPIERFAYEHLEYEPLINPRAHRLGKDNRILNDRFHAQYHRLLRVLAYHPDLTEEDRLALAYYLLLQDRIEEGMRQFESVDRNEIESRLQYDYVDAYLDFYRGDPASAKTIAETYLDYPVDRWRKRFETVIAQADEIDGGLTAVVDPDSRDQTQSRLASTEPNFELEVGEKAIELHYVHIKSARVNFYLMDIELLFSRNPFVQTYGGQFSSIHPNESLELELPEDQNVLTLDIPEALLSRNLMIEVSAAGQSRSRPFYAGAMVSQLIENYGQLKVANEADGKPLAGVYVKAYARMKNGEVRFYKDGYTDLRGRFDYASLSTSDLDNVERLAILILSEEHGAEVREAAPPKR